eukprot:COSAG01_NODE_18497_length_1072_cov_1.060637_1_plen_187_part_10
MEAAGPSSFDVFLSSAFEHVSRERQRGTLGLLERTPGAASELAPERVREIVGDVISADGDAKLSRRRAEVMSQMEATGPSTADALRASQMDVLSVREQRDDLEREVQRLRREKAEWEQARAKVQAECTHHAAAAQEATQELEGERRERLRQATAVGELEDQLALHARKYEAMKKRWKHELQRLEQGN